MLQIRLPIIQMLCDVSQQQLKRQDLNAGLSDFRGFPINHLTVLGSNLLLAGCGKSW